VSTTRPRLDRDTIVATGLDLAAESGAPTLSVRDLGVRLGADPTAIYRHYRNKDELMMAMLDELITRSVAAVRADRAQWRERMLELARSTFDLFAEHPSIGAEAIVLTTHGQGEMDAIELILEALTVAGLSGTTLVRYYAALSSHMLAGAAGTARARAEQGGDDTDLWIDRPLTIDPRRHPHVAAVATELTDLADRDVFLLGVESILDAAERAAAA
jgi:AcrR family transcriptional regulator